MSILNNEAEEIVTTATDKGDAIEKLIGAGASFADSLKYWKEYGANKNARGFKPKFYAYLREGIRSKSEVDMFVKENGSDNDYRYLKLFEGIAELANSIHEDLS